MQCAHAEALSLCERVCESGEECLLFDCGLVLDALLRHMGPQQQQQQQQQKQQKQKQRQRQQRLVAVVQQWTRRAAASPQATGEVCLLTSILLSPFCLLHAAASLCVWRLLSGALILSLFVSPSISSSCLFLSHSVDLLLLSPLLQRAALAAKFARILASSAGDAAQAAATAAAATASAAATAAAATEENKTPGDEDLDDDGDTHPSETPTDEVQGLRVGDRDRETETDAEGDRHRDRGRETETDGDTDRDSGRETGRDRDI